MWNVLAGKVFVGKVAVGKRGGAKSWSYVTKSVRFFSGRAIKTEQQDLPTGLQERLHQVILQPSTFQS